MPLRRSMCKHFHRTLFAHQLETVTLLKRGADQKQGTVTTFTVFRCRRGVITKTGETLNADIDSDHRTIWHLPRLEMDRIGIAFLSPLDRIVDQQGRVWQPESTVEIASKLMETEYDVQCLRID